MSCKQIIYTAHTVQSRSPTQLAAQHTLTCVIKDVNNINNSKVTSTDSVYIQNQEVNAHINILYVCYVSTTMTHWLYRWGHSKVNMFDTSLQPHTHAQYRWQRDKHPHTHTLRSWFIRALSVFHYYHRLSHTHACFTLTHTGWSMMLFYLIQ